MKNKEFKKLYTPFENNLPEIPWSEYPRPSLRRNSYLCLNGKWELSLQNQNDTEELGEILVPFPYESRISGIEGNLSKDDTLIYKRSFTVTEDFLNERVILHFGAVDQFCTVFVNDGIIGEHEGGYIPFSFDITKAVRLGENTITVEVEDPLDTELPYGKQSDKRGGMWYTPVSGIWQTVWLESVPDKYIKSVKITTDTEKALIEVAGGDNEKVLTLMGKEYHFNSNIVIKPESPILWSPENPHLYEFSLVSGKDRVEGYFAMREVKIDQNKILINKKPQFFHGLLDQGYFSDGIYLPASPDGFKNDILQMKKLGFNMLRKHIKIEPELFYYYCDKYGMFVFQDLVNSGSYNFLIDTALPTIGLKKGVSHKASKRRRKAFFDSAKQTVALLYNHPSVVYYTIFNEGWGQYDAEIIYDKMKNLDFSRVWDATSGWFWTNKSDVLSEHIYFKPLRLKNDGRPLVLSEFGGYSYKAEGHIFNIKDTYGYKFYKNLEDFKKGVISLYTEQVIPAIEKESLCAAVLTQVSDVEDETNGLFTYDRQFLKVNEEEMKQLSEKIYTAYEKAVLD